MAEAIAFGASVIAFIDIASKLALACKFFIDTARGNAPKDLKLILLETSSLKTTLETVEFLLSTSDDCIKEEEALAKQIGQPVEACKSCIVDLLELIPQNVVTSDSEARYGGSAVRHSEPVSRLLDALAWPRKRTKALALVEQISRHRDTIHLALSAELSKDVKEIKAELRAIRDALSGMQINRHKSQRREIHKWLETTNPTSNHHDAYRVHEDDTSQWVLRLDEWKAWLEGTSGSRFLWIHGIPGAGKTILASFLVEQIRAHCAATGDDKKHGLAYYYCYFGRSQDEAGPCLSWIFSQLCRQVQFIPEAVNMLQLCQQHPSLELKTILYKGLEVLLQKFETAYIVIDAVDESLPRAGLLDVIRRLSTESRFSKIRLLATSREYRDILESLQRISVPISMSNPHVEEDIRAYVVAELHNNRAFRRWPKNLCQEIETVLPGKAQGMFRWAVCQFDIFRRCRTIAAVRLAITQLPETLDATYERIFGSIDKEDRHFVHRALTLIIGRQVFISTEVPPRLTAPNLVSAILSDQQDQQFHDGSGSFYDTEALLDICGCLVKISTDGAIILAHYTVREYLESERISKVDTVDKGLSEFSIRSQDEALLLFLRTVFSVA
ncbi:hypothetical protein B0H63DRAFT_404201, partial [Podospora didyma]